MANPHSQTHPSVHSNDKFIFQKVMEGDWKAVKQAYGGQDRENVQKAKITKSRDTILHVAISTGKEEHVRDLVDLIEDVNVLNMANERGNTPLHSASSLGFVGMCQAILEREQLLMGLPIRDGGLIAARNKNGETPFFLAAIRGRRELFIYFLRHLPEEYDVKLRGRRNHGDERNDGVVMPLCRRNDGDTILHCIIASEFFDMAFWTLVIFPELANALNQKGFSPLQILANHPSAFPSGSRLKRTDTIIYACTWVDQLDITSFQRRIDVKQSSQRKFKIPENYETCYTILDAFKTIGNNFYSFKDVIFNLKNVLFKNSETQQRSDTNRLVHGDIENRYYPENYNSLVDSIKYLVRIPLIPLGLEFGNFRKIRVQKEKHLWAAQVMEKLIKNASSYEYEDTGMAPPEGIGMAGVALDVRPDENSSVEPVKEEAKDSDFEPDEISSGKSVTNQEKMRPQKTKQPSQTDLEDEIRYLVTAKNGVVQSVERHMNDSDEKSKEVANEAAILTAARLGIVEMVEGILKIFPVAIQDTDRNDKNVVLLAVENRQPQVYQFLLKRNNMNESIFQDVDEQGNSALHLAATLSHNRPWLIPGAALQMQWEIKWFKYIEDSMPNNFFGGFNKKGKTPKDVFSDTHETLVSEGGKWLTNTSQSCSVVAALIATVAFATATTVPGGVNDKTGFPILETHPPFKVFAISSLVALCFSVTSLVMFLSILTSRYDEKDFGKDLPLKLISGLSSLYVSLAAMLVSFCAGHFFVLREKLKFAAYPIYAVTCLPITFFALAQFPLYVDLLRCTLRKVPLRTYKTHSI